MVLLKATCPVRLRSAMLASNYKIASGKLNTLRSRQNAGLSSSNACVVGRRGFLSSRGIQATAVEGDAFHAECVTSTIETMVYQDNCMADIAKAAPIVNNNDVQVGGVSLPTLSLILGGLVLGGYAVKKTFDTPSRTYNENVGDEYDSWTEDGILEYYWGEHIHLGYYTKAEREAGYTKRDFIEAKYTFIDKMLEWSGCKDPKTILDVGCGIGGTSRHLAKYFPNAQITGITLSRNQVKRGTELAKERNINNVEFKVMDALAMDYPDNSFDFVWACESGEHMPDKKAYVEEMLRVLKPGGTLAIATWCQRDETKDNPLSEEDKDRLQFLYDEWAHPYFVSKEEYGRICQATGQLDDIVISDWTAPTIDSWRHSIWVGVWDPWIVIFKGPLAWYKVMREIVTLERMHRAFFDGLMEYGMIKAVKTESNTENTVVTVEKEP